MLAIAGCAATETYVPPEPQDSYPGSIINKELIPNPNKAAELKRAEREYKAALFFVAVSGMLGGVIGANSDALHRGDQITGEPYRYVIQTESNKNIVLIHQHSGFSVGDCVLVLVGKETGKVSMAYGGQCQNDS